MIKKRIVSIVLALMICAALAVAVFAGDYGEVVVTGNDAIDESTKMTVTFEAAKIEKGSLEISSQFGDATWEDLTFITVRPGSKVTVESTAADSSSIGVAAMQLLEDGRYDIYPPFMRIDVRTGAIEDWPFGKSLLDNGDKVGLIELFGSDGTYYVRIGKGEGEASAPAPDAAPAAEHLKVSLTSQRLTVDGAEKNAEIYNINDKNYFKLRDIAAMLNGTGSQFSVEYDAEAQMISITTGAAYEPTGGELVVGEDKSDSCMVSGQKVMIDGETAELTAYNLGGNNFFGLRDLGEALGFDVDYDADTRTMIVTSR